MLSELHQIIQGLLFRRIIIVFSGDFGFSVPKIKNSLFKYLLAAFAQKIFFYFKIIFFCVLTLNLLPDCLYLRETNRT